MIDIHPSAKVSALADIEDSVRGTRIVVGARSMIDSFVKIKPVGGCGDLLIGQDCTINSGCVIYTGNGVRIGSGVAVAANCTFAPVNHEYRARNQPIRSQGFRPSKGGIVIEDDVWIGSNGNPPVAACAGATGWLFDAGAKAVGAARAGRGL